MTNYKKINQICIILTVNQKNILQKTAKTCFLMLFFVNFKVFGCVLHTRELFIFTKYIGPPSLSELTQY